MTSNGVTAVLVLVTCLVVTCDATSYGVSISIYNVNTEKLTQIVADSQFGDAIAKEASTYCAENCDDPFKGNLSVELTGVIDDTPNSNVTITISSTSGDKLSVQKTEEMFEARVDKINEATGQKITKAGKKFFGIPADNTTNLVVTIVFLLFTLVFFLVVLYLVRHKVNHEKEHYEEMKERENSADAEIAT
ncbi:uncharacterized protein [Watersipora subatra]|uniref:uncharacterized protein n=1 Tax=Watersipora subatra TaxID=2589382 RepID=UPI00355BBE56